jgi:hypothetical protein
MGILDSLSNFLQDREGDFDKLEDTDSGFGPGPALILYNVPSGLMDEELVDMLSDGAPTASQKGISMARIRPEDSTCTELLGKTLQDALETVVVMAKKPKSPSPTTMTTDAGVLAMCPVLLFSGFSNPEMMAAYDIIAGEIYQESAGQAQAACAKAVPNAMLKTLRQVLDEISGDHLVVIKRE